MESSSDQEDQEVPEKSDLFGEDSDDSDSGPDDVDNAAKPLTPTGALLLYPLEVSRFFWAAEPLCLWMKEF